MAKPQVIAYLVAVGKTDTGKTCFYRSNAPCTDDPCLATRFTKEAEARAIAKEVGGTIYILVDPEPQKSKPKPPAWLFWSLAIGMGIVFNLRSVLGGDPLGATAQVTPPNPTAIAPAVNPGQTTPGSKVDCWQ